MHSIQFSPAEIQAIQFDRYHHPDPRVARRMEILLLKNAGVGHQMIAEFAGVCRSTVQRLLSVYLQHGLDGVREFHEKGRVSALNEHVPMLSEEFRLRPPRSVGEAAQRIEQATGIRRKHTQVRNFLRRTLGLQWRKVAAVPLPPNKTLEEHVQTQDNFLK
jgi:transposase